MNITLTRKAIDYLNSIRNGDHICLSVKGGGCSGFQYVWGFKESFPEIKWSDPVNDVLVIDPLAELYLLGSEIDYVNEIGGSFLKIKNPMVTSSCGCGDSFNV